MLKKLKALIIRADAFGDDLWALMPEQYQDDAPAVSNRGPLGSAWRSAMTSAIDTHRHLESLAALIAAKIPQEPLTLDSVVTIDGETHQLCGWSELYGNPVELILKRFEAGWDWERAVTTPADMDGPHSAPSLDDEIEASAEEYQP
jgi:hypothetical protein